MKSIRSRTAMLPGRKLFRMQRWMFYRWNTFQLYDYRGVEEHLSAMAAQGWRLEKASGSLWKYRRAEPASLRAPVPPVQLRQQERRHQQDQQDPHAQARDQNWDVSPRQDFPLTLAELTGEEYGHVRREAEDLGSVFIPHAGSASGLTDAARPGQTSSQLSPGSSS